MVQQTIKYSDGTEHIINYRKDDMEEEVKIEVAPEVQAEPEELRGGGGGAPMEEIPADSVEESA